MGKSKLYVTVRSLKCLYPDQCELQGITWNLSSNVMCFLKYSVFWYLNCMLCDHLFFGLIAMLDTSAVRI